MKILVAAIFCLSSAFAKITEIALPRDVHKCFERELERTNVTDSIGEVIFSRCVHKVLWAKQTPTLTEQPLGTDAMKWISGLVDMSHILDFQTGSTDQDVRPRSRRQAFRNQSERIQGQMLSGQGQTGRRRQTLRRQPRVRKEYRMLTDRERFMFHRALNMLKADTVSCSTLVF